MHKRKDRRKQIAARARWRAAETRAEAARESGIPDRAPTDDVRKPITLDLRSYGGRCLLIEPRVGYIAVRARDQETGEVTACALKTLLHRVADSLPRTLGARNFE
jgi:hypothetical protein